MRMENRTRKCSKHVNLTNFDCRQDVRLTQEVGLTQDVRSTRDISQIPTLKLALIHHYGNWVQQQIDQGWDGYLFTFLFNQLPGSIRAKSQQMEREVVRWYGRLATRTVRKPRSPQWAPLLPKGIFVPDLPVCKRSKQDLQDVVINDGLHMHGILVANRWGRISEPLDVHLERNLEKYLTGNLRHIDVQQITRTPGYVAEYGMKGLKRPSFSTDNILILPKTLGELPDRKPRLGTNPKFFQRAISRPFLGAGTLQVDDGVIADGNSGVAIGPYGGCKLQIDPVRRG
jgi:hypothetical protein